MLLRTRRARVAAAFVGLALVAAAVLITRELRSTSFDIKAAPHADAPECSKVARGYPGSINGHRRASVDVPGVAVWGDESVVVRCGVTPPGPSTNLCASADGVDWVMDEAKSTDRRKILTTYGRHPA